MNVAGITSQIASYFRESGTQAHHRWRQIGMKKRRGENLSAGVHSEVCPHEQILSFLFSSNCVTNFRISGQQIESVGKFFKVTSKVQALVSNYFTWHSSAYRAATPWCHSTNINKTEDNSLGKDTSVAWNSDQHVPESHNFFRQNT